MKTYKFYDTDLSGFAEFDIEGDHYTALLDICYRYCAFFSFRVIDSNIVIPAELEKHRIPLTESIVRVYSHYYQEDLSKATKEVFCFRLCYESFEVFKSLPDSLFKWICGWGFKNPEDLAFFRADGSVFFSSLVHEGVCTLSPNDNENVSSVLSFGHWE